MCENLYSVVLDVGNFPLFPVDRKLQEIIQFNWQQGHDHRQLHLFPFWEKAWCHHRSYSLVAVGAVVSAQPNQPQCWPNSSSEIQGICVAGNSVLYTFVSSPSLLKDYTVVGMQRIWGWKLINGGRSWWIILTYLLITGGEAASSKLKPFFLTPNSWEGFPYPCSLPHSSSCDLFSIQLVFW